MLGINRTASQTDIKTAYRDKIRTAHPDIAGGSDEEAAHLNEAYAILSDPERRAAYDRGVTSTRDVANDTVVCPVCADRVSVQSVNLHWQVHLIEQHGPLCAGCNRHPTKPLRLKSHAGFLLWRTVGEIEQNFCKSCGTGVFREVQARNITRGPWGIISFFSSILALFGNAGRFSDFKGGLDEPEPHDAAADTAIKGRPILFRPAVLLVLSIFVVAGFLLFNSSSSSSYSGTSSSNYTPPSVTKNAPPPPPVPRTVGFSTGTCVTVDGNWVEESPTCSGADGTVVSVVSTPSSCPSNAGVYIERDDGRIACILEY